MFMTTYNDEDLKQAITVWKRNRRLKQSSIAVYCRWIKRFQLYCSDHDLDEAQELTLTGARKFAKKYACLNKCKEKTALQSARSALFALSTARRIRKTTVLPWHEPDRVVNTHSPLVVEFAHFLDEVRGNPESTVRKKGDQINAFLVFLKKRNRRVCRIRLIDIDTYILLCAKRYARTTVADICSTLRVFIGFYTQPVA